MYHERISQWVPRMTFNAPLVISACERAQRVVVLTHQNEAIDATASPLGVARSASCTPANTGVCCLQDIYKQANAAEVLRWQFFRFQIIKTPDQHIIQSITSTQSHSKGNLLSSTTLFQCPPTPDINITNYAPLVSEIFLDIAATRGRAEAETGGGGEIFINYGGAKLWERGPPPVCCFKDD